VGSNIQKMLQDVLFVTRNLEQKMV